MSRSERLLRRGVAGVQAGLLVSDQISSLKASADGAAAPRAALTVSADGAAPLALTQSAPTWSHNSSTARSSNGEPSYNEGI